MLRAAVCVSGGGTNLQAIIDAAAAGTITNTELALVISNKPGAYALERAKKAGISSEVLVPKDYENRNAFEGRIINIHPSLIPSHCGAGYYGLKVHESVLARGNKVTGATVHFVDEGTDSGPIILQKAVEVLDDDTPEVLQKRVMEQAEWKILPEAIDLIANGKLEIVDGIVKRK